MGSILELKRQRGALVAEMKELTETAERERRDLTPTETIKFNTLDKSVSEITEQMDQAVAVERSEAVSTSRVEGFAKRILDAGWNLRDRPEVTLNAAEVLEQRAPTLPAVGNWDRPAGYISPLGYDKRFLYPLLPTKNVGTESAILDFRQTARTLTGTVQRNLDASTTKATVDATITAVAEDLKQFAVIIPDIPNAVLESVETLAAFFDAEGRFQVQKALDAHVMAQIVAASPPFGTSGTGLVAKIRNGIATMRATGANPSVVVLNPTDAATLDLEADAGGYIFPTRDSGSSSPLWGQRVVERIGAGTEAPYLIDPEMLGILYLGEMRFQADPYSGFASNLTRLRIETKALYHVRQAEGARRVNAT